MLLFYFDSEMEISDGLFSESSRGHEQKGAGIFRARKVIEVQVARVSPAAPGLQRCQTTLRIQRYLLSDLSEYSIAEAELDVEEWLVNQSCQVFQEHFFENSVNVRDVSLAPQRGRER